ncbi:hypothetical protein MTO96_039670 [Rhipicephalus appendiculatus]
MPQRPTPQLRLRPWLHQPPSLLHPYRRLQSLHPDSPRHDAPLSGRQPHARTCPLCRLREARTPCKPRYPWLTWSEDPSSAVPSAYASTGRTPPWPACTSDPVDPGTPAAFGNWRTYWERTSCSAVTLTPTIRHGVAERPAHEAENLRDILQQLGLVILKHRGRHLPPSRSPGHQHSHRPQHGHGGLPVPRDEEYRVVDWRVHRQLFKQDTGGTDLLQLVADNARAATVVAKVPQGKPAPDIQHLALRAARRRAERQALKRAQPELWTVFRKVDAVCRRHANRRRNQGWVSVCVSIDRSRDGTRAWRLLKCLLMVPRAFHQVLYLAVHPHHPGCEPGGTAG